MSAKLNSINVSGTGWVVLIDGRAERFMLRGRGTLPIFDTKAEAADFAKSIAGFAGRTAVCRVRYTITDGKPEGT